jgi:hypothetical protein
MLQKKNSLSHQLRRVIFYGSVISTRQYNHGICTTPRKMTQISSIVNGFYTNHRDKEAYGDQGHTPWRKLYTNMIPKTRDDVGHNVTQTITFTRTTRTQPTNTYCIEKTEDDGDAYLKILEMS